MARNKKISGWLNKYQTGGYYEVQKGDNLWEISQNLGISFDKLLAANPQLKDPNLIQVGQQINLPKGNTPSVSRPVASVRKTVAPSQPSVPAMTFMSMPAGTIDRGMVSENTSVPIRTVKGEPMQTGYQPQTGTEYKLNQELHKQIREAQANARGERSRKKPIKPGYATDNTAVVKEGPQGIISTAQTNAPEIGYVAPHEVGLEDIIGGAVVAAPFAVGAGVLGAAAAAPVMGTLEAINALPLFYGAPEWATVGNALTAAAIPGIAHEVKEGKYGNAALFALPYAIKAGSGAVKGIMSAWETLKEDAQFLKLLKSKPNEAMKLIETKYKPLYNTMFDSYDAVRKFTKNPIDFVFGKNLNTLTPEIVKQIENIEQLPSEVKQILTDSRVIGKSFKDYDYAKKIKDKEKQLEALNTIYRKMHGFSEDNFYYSTGMNMNKESVVKTINQLERQLGKTKSTLTYQDDPSKIVDLSKYDWKTPEYTSKVAADYVNPVNSTTPQKEYMLSSTGRNYNPYKHDALYAFRYNKDEQLVPYVEYDPAKSETSPGAVFKKAIEQFEKLPSKKKFVFATSLSSDSKPMELARINKFIREGKVRKVEYEGMSMLNNMGYTEKLPRQVLLQEINSQIDEINLMLPNAKKLRRAELHKDGTIWVPQITLTKMKEGGYITDQDMWLTKYKTAGEVMPADVLMDPKKMAQWMKDHPEATVANANKQVIKDPRAVHVDPRLIKNAPKARVQETVDYPASDPRSQSYTGAPATTLLMNPNQIQGEGARIIEGGNNLPILAGIAGNAAYPFIAAAAPFVAPIEGAANAYFGYEGAKAAGQAYNDFKYYDYDQGLIHSGEAALGILPAIGGVSNAMKELSPYARNLTLRAAKALGPSTELNPIIDNVTFKLKTYPNKTISEFTPSFIKQKATGEIPVFHRPSDYNHVLTDEEYKNWAKVIFGKNNADKISLNELKNAHKESLKLFENTAAGGKEHGLYINNKFADKLPNYNSVKREFLSRNIRHLDKNGDPLNTTILGKQERLIKEHGYDISKMTPQERHLMEAYAHGYDNSINDVLRRPNKAPVSQFYQDMGEKLNQGILKNKFKTPTTVRRGIQSDYEVKLVDPVTHQPTGKTKMRSELTTGDVFVDDSFISASSKTGQSWGLSDYGEIIEIPGGGVQSVGMPEAANYTEWRGEGETLLPKGLVREVIGHGLNDPANINHPWYTPVAALRTKILNPYILPYAIPAAGAAATPTILKNYQGLQQHKNGGWLNQYGSGTTKVQPTLTFTTRPVGAVNVGAIADNTSAVINTPKGPVVTGAKTNVVANPEITKKVKQAQFTQKLQQNLNFQKDKQGNVIKDSQGNPIIAPAAGTTTSVIDDVAASTANAANDILGTVGDVANEVYSGIVNTGNIPFYTNGESYEDAYNNARKAGITNFVWKNPSTGSIEIHNTKSDLSEEEQLKKYGITDSQIEWNYYNPIRHEFGNRLYNNVYPFGYGSTDFLPVMGKTFRSLVLNRPTYAYDKLTHYGNYDPFYNEVEWEEKIAKQINDLEADIPTFQQRRDAIRMYAGIPQQHNTFSISKYKYPKMEATAPGQTYYSINMTPAEKNEYINRFYNDGKGYNDDTKKEYFYKDIGVNQEMESTDGNIMGRFTAIKNKDNSGEYLTYYDKWDLDPGDWEKKYGYMPPQVGNPFLIHDRIYVKDYGKDGNHLYRALFYNDDELKNMKVDKDNAAALEQELLNRGYKINSGNTQDIEKALQDFQNTNTQEKKKLGGWLNKYQSGTTNAQPYTNVNTVSLSPQPGGQSFINYTNTATNPVSLTNAKFSCPGGTCNLPTGEIAPGQTVQIPITYISENPGSLYLFNSEGTMQNYKIDPRSQVQTFKNETTPSASVTTQVDAGPGIEATKKEEKTTSAPKPKYVFKCPEGARCGEVRGAVGGIGEKGGAQTFAKEIYVNPQTGSKRVKETLYDAEGNVIRIKEDLPLNSIYMYGGNTWLDKYQTGGPTTRYSYVLDDDNGNTVFDDNGNPIIINPTTNYTVPEWLPQVNITAPRIIPSSNTAASTRQSNAASTRQSNASLTTDIILDGLQFIPGPLGTAASVVGMGKNLYEGDYVGAGLDLANLVTLGGAKWFTAAAKLAKAAGKAKKASQVARNAKMLEHASNPNLWKATGLVRDLAKVKTTDSNPEYKNEPKKAPNLLGKKTTTTTAATPSTQTETATTPTTTPTTAQKTTTTTKKTAAPLDPKRGGFYSQDGKYWRYDINGNIVPADRNTNNEMKYGGWLNRYK